MIEYKDLIDLGFKKRNYSDSVHFDRYGYHSFALEKEFHIQETKKVVLFEWHPTELKVNYWIGDRNLIKQITELSELVDTLKIYGYAKRTISN